MKAVLCKAWGDPETLTLETVSEPIPGAGEVLIDVKTAGVNFADTLMIQGRYQVKPPLPFIPGFEVAGIVAALGKNVPHLSVGRRVLAFVPWGAYAEKVAAPMNSVMPIPSNMPFTDAAAFAITYGTSHLALAHRGRLQAGETLLVHGASGGVGLTAVELGKRLGATVIATASSEEKLELCRRYGADHTINYAEDDFVSAVKDLTQGKGADVIFDPVGGEVFSKSLRCLAWEGRLLVVGFASGKIPNVPANLTLVKNTAVVGVFWGAYAQHGPDALMDSMKQLTDWYKDSHLTPHISATFKLEAAAAAMRSLMNRKSTGKVVLEI